MSRYLIIFGIWMAGFSLVFMGYLAYPSLVPIITTILPFLLTLDNQIIGALIAGMASSLVTVIAVSLWAYSSKSKSF